MSEAAFAAELDRVLADLRGVLLAAYRGAPVVAAAKPDPVRELEKIAAKRPAPPPAPKPLPSETRDDVTANGVTVSYRNLTVTHGPRSAILPRRGCELVAVLAKAKPHVVPREELARRAWPDLTKDSGVTLFSTLLDKLVAPLAVAGLRINTMKGFGLSLTTLDGQ